MLFSRRVKPGREADFEAWAHGVNTAAHHFPGHVSASVLDVPGTPEYHVLYTFADRASLDAWLDSDERRRWLARVSKMTKAERGLQAVTGLETWFKLPGPRGIARLLPGAGSGAVPDSTAKAVLDRTPRLAPRS